jgi:hypothetical protein
MPALSFISLVAVSVLVGGISAEASICPQIEDSFLEPDGSWIALSLAPLQNSTAGDRFEIDLGCPTLRNIEFVPSHAKLVSSKDNLHTFEITTNAGHESLSLVAERVCQGKCSDEISVRCREEGMQNEGENGEADSADEEFREADGDDDEGDEEAGDAEETDDEGDEAIPREEVDEDAQSNVVQAE